MKLILSYIIVSLLSACLGLVGGHSLLLVGTNSKQMMDKKIAPEYAFVNQLHPSSPLLKKFYDGPNIVCYVYGERAIDCMRIH